MTNSLKKFREKKSSNISYTRDARIYLVGVSKWHDSKANFDMHHQVTLITNTAPRTIDDVRKKRDGTSRRSTESASSTRVNSRFRFEAHHTGRSNN